MSTINLDYIQVKPPQLKLNSFSIDHIFSKPLDSCWKILNHSDTFSKHQLFPYNVEFFPLNKSSTNHMQEKVWTNHHGPLLSAAGQLVTLTPQSYRDLHYNYGSYAISFRLIRPVRLQLFFTALESNKTKVTVQFDTYVASWFNTLWTYIQYLFWKPFFYSVNLSIKH